MVGLYNSDPNTKWYGYVPSRAGTCILVFFFALSTCVHLFQAVKYRTWFMIGTTVLCGAMEVTGWAARAYSSFSPESGTAFKIQTSVLVLGPTPLLAANFVIFGRLIRHLGESYSRLKPRRYTLIFTSCDIMSLFIQSGGGGIAASANDADKALLGSRVILVGIILQALIIVGFSGFAIEYFKRYNEALGTMRSRDRYRLMNPDEVSRPEGHIPPPGRLTSNLRKMKWALAVNTALLFIRGVYRIVELSGGWGSKIMRTQILFNVFDGAMILLAMYTTNFIHPGVFLEPNRPRAAGV